MKRVVTLGFGQKVPLGVYVAGWRKALANPEARFPHSLEERWPATGAEIVAQFRKGMVDRINKHDPAFGVGRKWAEDWQRAMIQTAHRLNTPRLVIEWLPAELKGRFAHRLR